jgi:hypothetical protein
LAETEFDLHLHCRRPLVFATVVLRSLAHGIAAQRRRDTPPGLRKKIDEAGSGESPPFAPAACAWLII